MTEAKKLCKIKEQAMIGGVCAGLGEYFNMDPTVIRIIWVVIFFIGGSGLFIYIILWIILPEKNQNSVQATEVKKK